MLRHSRMEDVLNEAPRFALTDVVTGKTVSRDDYAGSPGLLVAFICNHCPFVLHILDEFVKFAAEYQQKGLSVVAISSNDIEFEPEDTPEKMVELARERGFSFPYLYDGDQAVALAYGAVCTPEFALFDRDRKLAYRAQFDASRPRTVHWKGNEIAVTGADLREAADAVLAGLPVPDDRPPSVGCSIKWSPGNEPDWA